MTHAQEKSRKKGLNKGLVNLFLKGLLTFTIVIAVAAVGILTVATTSLGLNLAVSAAQKFIPSLSIQAAEGSLLKPTLTGITFESESFSIKAKRFHYALSNLALFDRFVTVSDIEAQGLFVRLISNQNPSSTPEIAKAKQPQELISLPVGFRIDRIKLKDLDVTADNLHLNVGKFSSALLGKASSVRLTDTSIDGVDLTLPLAPEKKTSLGEKLSEVDHLLSAPLLPELPDVNLPIHTDIDNLVLTNFTLNTQKIIDRLAFANLSAHGQHAWIEGLQTQTPMGNASLQGKVTTAGKWPIDFEVHVSDAGLTSNRKLSARTHLTGEILDRLTLQSTVNLPETVDITLSAFPARPNLEFEAYVTGKALLRELENQTSIRSIELKPLRIWGNWDKWHAQISVGVDSLKAENPKLEATINGKRFAADYDIKLSADKLADSHLAGSASLSEKGLAAGVKINSHVESVAALIKLAGLQNSLPYQTGVLDLSAAASFATDEKMQTLSANVDALTLEGNLDKHPVSLDLAGHMVDPRHFDLKKLTAKFSGNIVEGLGRVTDVGMDLNLKIRADDLASVLPDLTGSISADAHVFGALTEPDAEVSGSVRDLKYPGVTLTSADLSASVRSLGKKTSSALLTAQNILASGINVKRMELSAQGTQTAHTVRIREDGTAAVQLTLQGAWNEAKRLWAGRMDTAQISAKKMRWQPQGNVSLSFDTDSQSLNVAPHCWKEAKTQALVCADKELKLAKAGHADISFDSVALSLARPFLEPGVRLLGHLNGKATAAWTAPEAKALKAAVRIEGFDAGLRTNITDKPVSVVLKVLTLDAQFDQNVAKADLMVALNPKTPLTTSVTVADPAGRADIKGKISAQGVSLTDFAPIVAALSPITQTQGTLVCDVTVSGTPQAPAADGRISIENLTLSGPAVPLDMKPSNLSMVFNSSKSELSGTLASSQGTLNVKGSADWSDITKAHAQISVNGKNFEIVSPPYVKALTDADVTMTADADRISLAGTIDINKALLSAETIPESAVSVSSDEVIADADMKPLVKEESHPIAVNSTLAIRLGDDVRVKAFGLNAQMTGAVTVTQANDTLGLRGTITMPQGHFQAYGQDLVIEKGAFIFAGPVSNPTVALEAVRNPDSIENDVRVGIRISGTANQMKSEVFSDPAMAQAEQLSYLLRGRGLDATSDDNSMLSSALLTLGLSQAGHLISGIGDALMIRDLGVSTQGVGDNSQVVVSGYVLPDLQLKYAMNIFDSMSTLTMRYRLLPKLFVEASSGVNQAVEFLYNFEF